MVLADPENKILLTGGTGLLGKELLKLAPYIHAPTHTECDILNYAQILKTLENIKPSIVVHAAAFTDVKLAEKSPAACIETNVVGTINVIKACKKKKTKLVYISTDYVFDGKKGNYNTNDGINPLSKYAKTKAAAELLVRTYDNHLVIRTSFFGHSFPYEKACTNQWTTKDYVDIISLKVLQTIKSNKKGIVHIGSRRRSIYEMAKERNPDVKKIKIEDLNFPIPQDVSLNMENNE